MIDKVVTITFLTVGLLLSDGDDWIDPDISHSISERVDMDCTCCAAWPEVCVQNNTLIQNIQGHLTTYLGIA